MVICYFVLIIVFFIAVVVSIVTTLDLASTVVAAAPLAVRVAVVLLSLLFLFLLPILFWFFRHLANVLFASVVLLPVVIDSVLTLDVVTAVVDSDAAVAIFLRLLVLCH